VSVYFSEEIISKHPWSFGNTVFTIASRSSQPAVFQVCHESRKECLPLFQVIGGMRVANFRPDPASLNEDEFSHQPRVYFNPAVDIIFLHSPFYVELADIFNIIGREFSQLSVKKLAIPAHWFCDEDAYDLLRLISQQLLYTNIDEIMVIFEPEIENETESENEPDSGQKLSSNKGMLEAVELANWHWRHD
jgi:hypothetical protein